MATKIKRRLNPKATEQEKGKGKATGKGKGKKKESEMPIMTDEEFHLMMSFVVDQHYSPRNAEWALVNDVIKRGWIRWIGGRAVYEVTVDGYKAYFANRTSEDKKEETKRRWRVQSRESRHNVTTTINRTTTKTVKVVKSEPRPLTQKVTIRLARKSFRNHVWTLEELQELKDAETAARAEALNQAMANWEGM